MYVCTCEGAAHYSVLLCNLSSQCSGLQAWWFTTHPNTHTLKWSTSTELKEAISFYGFFSSFLPGLCLWDVSLSFFRARLAKLIIPLPRPLRSCPLQLLSFIHKCGATSIPLAQPGQAQHSKMLKLGIFIQIMNFHVGSNCKQSMSASMWWPHQCPSGFLS